MDERELADRALSGDPAATRRLVVLVLPVVQARIARLLNGNLSSKGIAPANRLAAEVNDLGALEQDAV